MKHSLFSSTSPSGLSAHPTHEQIARRAEELWQSYGTPADRDEEIWLEAEHQLNRATASATETTATKSAKAAGEGSAGSAAGATVTGTRRSTSSGGRTPGKGK